MKKIMIPVILAAGVLVLPVLFTGCGMFGIGLDSNLKALQGRWYDVNGDTTLEFKGRRMTVKDAYIKETYTVRVRGEDVKYIENAKSDSYDKGFGMLGTIEIRDGVLSAYEQIMDAEGHKYRFVREEDLEKEKEVIDKSRDLPKTIESQELVEFSLSFSLEDSWYDVPADGSWERGRYHFEITRQDDGNYSMNFDGMGSSYIFCDFSGQVTEDYMRGLAKLIGEQKIAEHNGMYLTNNENFKSWSLTAEYASGEKLELYRDGRPALECPFSIKAFLDYADERAEVLPREESSGSDENGASNETTPEESENAEVLEYLQGHWVDVNSDTTLDIEGDQLTMVLYGGMTEVYTVRVIGEEYKQLVNWTNGREDSFDIVSQMHLQADGSLQADEMILDADGHSFRFVREDELAAEKEIRDLSEDLPKEIESTELTEFHLSFSLDDTLYDVPQGDPWTAGHFSIDISKEDGSGQLDFNAMGDSYVICQYSGKVSGKFMKGLAELIKSEKLPEHNGYHMENNEDFDGWFLSAEYASGEELLLQADGRASLECPFSIRAFLEYVNREVQFDGE